MYNFFNSSKKKKNGVNIITTLIILQYDTWYLHLFLCTIHDIHIFFIWDIPHINAIEPPSSSFHPIFFKKKKKSVSKISQFIHTNHLLQLHCCLNLNSTNWPSKLHYHYRHPKIFTHQPHHTTWPTYQNQINEDSKSCTIALPTTLLLSTMAIWWTSHPYQHTKIPIMNPL